MAKTPKDPPSWLVEQRERQAEFRAILMKRLERDREIAEAAKREKSA